MAAVKQAMLAYDPDEDDLDDDDPDATPVEDVVRIWYDPNEGGES